MTRNSSRLQGRLACCRMAAIECINDWWFDPFDEPLIEAGDEVKIAARSRQGQGTKTGGSHVPDQEIRGESGINVTRGWPLRHWRPALSAGQRSAPFRSGSLPFSGRLRPALRVGSEVSPAAPGNVVGVAWSAA